MPTTYGSIYLDSGTSSQTLQQHNTYYTINQWKKVGNVLGVSVSIANSNITILNNGAYAIQVDLSGFFGKSSYLISIFINGVRQNNLTIEYTPPTTAFITYTGLKGFVFCNVNDIVDVRISNISQDNSTFSLIQGNFSIYNIDGGGGSGIGATGAQGPQGLQGLQGAAGNPGPPGLPGAQGPQGSPGVTGPAGGPIGPTGSIGSTGPVGSTGPQGNQGSPGVTGAIGPQGPTGTMGVQGDQGSPGVTGATGPQGNQGSPGVTGSQGLQGSPGVTGAAGPQGQQGSPGVTGSQGQQGSPGATGAIGPQGNQGSPGVTGPQGNQGSPGVTGAQGPQGPAGSTGAGFGTTNVGTNMINGSIAFTTKVFSSTGTVDTNTNDAIILADTSGGAFSLKLPAVATGRTIIIKDKSNTFNINPLTIVPNNTESIDGTPNTIVLSSSVGQLVFALNDGTNWHSSNPSPFGNFMNRKVSYFSGYSNSNGTLQPGVHYWGFNGSQLNITPTPTNPNSDTPSSATKLAATKRIKMSITTINTTMEVSDLTSINAGVSQYGFWRGNASNRGGFLFKVRFAITNMAVNGFIRSIFGFVDATGTSTTDWTTNTTIAKIGMGFTAKATASGTSPSGTNWQMIEGAHSTPTTHDLGSNFAVTLNDFLELTLYANANDTIVSYSVSNLTTGKSTNGILNTSLPTNTTFILPFLHIGVGSGANGSLVASGTTSWDLSSWYLENFDT